MNQIAKSCIWILVLILLIRCGGSAPRNPIYTDGTNVEHRAKRSANLINFVGNMLQKHSGGMDSEWPGFANMFSYGYGPRNWNSCENDLVEDNDQSDIPFYVDLDSSPETSLSRPEAKSIAMPPFLRGNHQYNPDTNCPSYVNGNNYPKAKNGGTFPFPKVNYQYDTRPRSSSWNAGGGYGDSEEAERCEYGPNMDSVDIDWNKAIPPQENVELEEVISRNFYMTPPQMDTRIDKPFFYNQLVPWSRNWQTRFEPGNQEVPLQNPNNVPQFHVLNCSPAKDIVKPAIDARTFGEAPRKNEDDYILLLIKKNHVLGDRRNTNRGQDQYPKSTDEDLCWNDSKKVTQKPDLSIPCDTTSEATTTTTTESAPTTSQSEDDCTASSGNVGGTPADTTYVNSVPESSPVTDCPTECISDATENVIVGSALGTQIVSSTEGAVENVTEKADDVHTDEIVTEQNGEGDSSTYPPDSTPSYVTDTPSTTTNCYKTSEYDTSDDRTSKDDTESATRSTTMAPTEGEGSTYTTRSNGGQASTEPNSYEPVGTESEVDNLSSDEVKLKNVDEAAHDEQAVNLSPFSVGDSVSQGTQTYVTGKQSEYDTISSDEKNLRDVPEDTENKQGLISSSDIVGDSLNQGADDDSSSDTKNSKDLTEDKEEEQGTVLSKNYNAAEGDSISSTGSTVSGSESQGLYIVMPSDTTGSVEIEHKDTNSDEGLPVDFTENAEDGYMSVFTKKYREGGSTHSTSGSVSSSVSQAAQSTLSDSKAYATGTQSEYETIGLDKRNQAEGITEYTVDEQGRGLAYSSSASVGDFVSRGRQIYGTGIQSEHGETSSAKKYYKDITEDTEDDQTVVLPKKNDAADGASSSSNGSEDVYSVMSRNTTRPMEMEDKDAHSDEGLPVDFTENAEDGYMSEFTKKYRGRGQRSRGSTHSTGSTVRGSVRQVAQSSTSTSSDAKAYEGSGFTKQHRRGGRGSSHGTTKMAAAETSSKGDVPIPPSQNSSYSSTINRAMKIFKGQESIAEAKQSPDKRVQLKPLTTKAS